MAIRILRRALALLTFPVVAANAQGSVEESGNISRSLLIQSGGVGILLPLGEKGALQLSMWASGRVAASASSGGSPSSPPRSAYDAELTAGYLRLSPPAERVRSFRYARVGYGYAQLNPKPHNPEHRGTVSVGVGALAQVTPRVGLIADAGLRWTVRRAQIQYSMAGGFPPYELEQTTTNWGLATAIGVTIRRKP